MHLIIHKNGRGGKGSLFVFASGNGGANDDNCNYDGYTNSIYTLTVGAVDRKHVLPYYAERCTALLITTYSSGSGSYIYTTDVGVKKCTNLHGGTSAAAPIAAGVFSLVLQIRPDLTWRDMQYLVLNSAMTFNLEDPDWQLTKAGRLYNYKFGYGKLDAYTLIQNAKTYKLLNPQVNIEMPIINVTKPIPMNQEGIISKVVVKKSDVDKANMKRLEHVTVTINVIHERRGDIEVDLISPNGIVSTIGLPRMYDENIGGLNNWTFMSVKHWLVRNPKFNGIFVDWMLKLWGERTDNNESGKNSSDTNNNSDKTSTTIITNTTPSSIADDDNNKISTSTIPSSPPVNDDDNKISTTNNPISTETQPATTNAADNNNDDSSSSSSNSINSNWIWGIGVVMAFTLAYMVYATRKWYWDDVKKIVSEVFSRRTYASVLRQPSDRTSNDEDGDLIPLTRGNKQFTTSRELKRHKRVPLPPPTPSPTDNSHKFLDPDEIGHDINVTGIWKEGITGKGVVAAIVDDGLDMYSEDLADNFYAEGSYDFNDHNPLPKPRLIDDTHGTRCAGEIAAVKNSVCGIGIAPDVKIADADEAEALNYKFQKNDIYSCSWGPPDDGQSAEAPQGVILKAIVKGIEKGRGGKGSLFVFASGNGGANDDNCNYDGYTNSIYTLTVGAVDRKHVLPYYAERCTALLITTYSSGSGSYIYTTDVGVKKCTNLHGGTSAAAPIAAGVFSLVLQIR
ncbi:10384_t:CDS:10 [Entrophospora sp. SA101]|nr:10384_t:CDS:10 [Entrophospora sp. SA101]